jgi:5-methylcytosine-specific restriction endonuclease McrA
VTDPRDRRAFRRASQKVRGLPCHWCGRPSTELDHVVAIADGGAPYDTANLVPACRACNAARGAEVARRRASGAGHPSRRW